MIYTDSALQSFRESFDRAELNYDIAQVDERLVRVVIHKDDISIVTWFDADKQIFGFDMLNGGCKTYEDFGEFEGFLTTYLKIYTDFIPSAKVVADTFEATQGIDSVYDNFSGNKQTGYTARFKVLGKNDLGVLVSKETDGYVAKLVQYAEDGSRYKVLSEYKYEVDEVRNVSLIPTIHSYMDELSRRYGESDTIDINRNGINAFEFIIEGLNIVATVDFMYKQISYNITTVGDFEFNQTWTPDTLDEAYNLSALYLFCKDFYDDSVAESDFDDSEDSYVDTSEQASEDEETYDEGNFNDDVYAEEQENEQMQTVEDSGFDSDFGNETDLVPQISEDEQEQETEQNVDTESDYSAQTYPPVEDNNSEIEEDDFSIKVLKNNGVVISVQFTTADDVYNISADKCSDLGLPLERIADEVKTVKRHGMLMTEDEVRLHTFAKDITNNDEKCQEIISKLFA